MGIDNSEPLPIPRCAVCGRLKIVGTTTSQYRYFYCPDRECCRDGTKRLKSRLTQPRRPPLPKPKCPKCGGRCKQATSQKAKRYFQCLDFRCNPWHRLFSVPKTSEEIRDAECRRSVAAASKPRVAGSARKRRRRRARPNCPACGRSMLFGSSTIRQRYYYCPGCRAGLRGPRSKKEINRAYKLRYGAWGQRLRQEPCPKCGRPAKRKDTEMAFRYWKCESAECNPEGRWFKVPKPEDENASAPRPTKQERKVDAQSPFCRECGSQCKVLTTHKTYRFWRCNNEACRLRSHRFRVPRLDIEAGDE